MIRYQGVMEDGDFHKFETADDLYQFIEELCVEEYDVNPVYDKEARKWCEAKFEFYSDVMAIGIEEED